MAITFPTTLDSLSNPLPSDPTLNPGNPLDHAGQHGDVNDAIEALEAKVGVNNSVVVTTIDYKLNTHINASSGVHGLTGAVVGTTDAQTLTGKTISGSVNTLSNIPKASVTGAPAGAFVGTTDTQTLSGKTITSAANTLTIDGSVSTLSNIPQASITGLTASFSAKQNLDAGLTALSAFNTNGFVAQTANDTFAGRTITAANTKITVANGDGVSGNPTLTINEANFAAIPQASVTGLTAALALYTPVFSLKGSDQSVTSSVTVTNDTALVVALAANRTYEITLVLGATGAVAGDIRTTWAVTGTAAASGPRLCNGPDVAETTVGYVSGRRATIASEIVYGTYPTEAGILEKFIAVGGVSGGTLTLRWAQGTSSVTSTVVKAGSYLLATPVI